MGVVSLLSGQAEKRGVRLTAAVAKDIPAIVADARSLKQILLNLTANAIKFNRETGGEVELSATMDAAGAVHIAVRHRRGMDAEDLEARAGALSPRQVRRAARAPASACRSPGADRGEQGAVLAGEQPGKGTTARLTFPSALVLAG